jgi:hypothetical protein
MSFSFESFLENEKWKTLKEHFHSLPQSLEQNISLAIQNDKTDDLRKWLEAHYIIKKEDISIQDRMKGELFTGNVVAIDGTCVDCDLITGYQARIAIVAVNYKNNRTDYVTYISEPFINYTKSNIKEQLEYMKQKAAGKVGITSAHIRAIMLFKERDFILNRPEKYKMVQGDILPYELRTGQGKLKGLNACLRLGRKLLNEDNIIAIQTTTIRPQLRWVGTALREGEYVELYDYFNDLNAFLVGDDYRGPAHFNEEDEKTFRNFNEDVKGKFCVGIYKVKRRSYVFYAPKKNLDTMINLVFADSKYQSLRGVPLLLDYADIICSRLFAARDFRKIVEMKLARKNKLEFEISEKSLRRR